MKVHGASLTLLFCSLLAAVPALADTLLYTSINSSNPYTGNTKSYNLLSHYAISDPFTVPINSDIETLSIVYWDLSDTLLLKSVDMAISSSALPGSGFETLTPVSNTILGINSKGYYLVEADFTFASIDWSGAGWITLENAVCGDAGCSVLWDLNGTTKNAEASVNGGTPIYGETFSLDGNITPEPNSLILLGSGLLGLAGILRRKLAR
jgi:hypothetical protein